MNKRALLRHGKLVSLMLAVGLVLSACGPAVTPTPEPTKLPAALPTQPPAPTKAPEATQAPTAVATVAPPRPVGGELVVAIRNADYDTLDPHVSSFTQAAYVFMNIFDTLVYLDAEGNYVAGLALAWEPSADAREWTLKLRKDVKFHDGTSFNAKAVQFNLDRMVDSATGSKNAGPALNASHYERTEVVDDYTVKVYFRDPSPLLPFVLSSPFLGMVSPTAVEKHGADFTKALIGSGPFKFVSEVRGTEIILERNPDYNWAPAHMHQGPAYIDRLKFRFITEDETRLAALEMGEVNVIDEIPPTSVERLQKNPDFQVLGAPKVGVARSLWFNTELSPVDDVRVRKAILYAIDRDAINAAVFKGVYPLAYQILTRGTKFYDKSLETMYTFDPQKAVALLEEAGWKEVNAEGYRVKEGKELSLFHATFPGYVAETPAEIIQAQLKKVGIKFSINVMTGTAMMDGMASRTSTFHTALIGTYSPDPGMILRRTLHSSGMGTTNYAHFTTPELDNLLDDGLAIADEAKRTEIYSKIQRIVMENAVVAPIYANVSIFGASKKVSGLKFDPYAYPLFFDVAITK